MVASSTPIGGVLAHSTVSLFMLYLGLEPIYWWRSSSSTLLFTWPIRQQPPNYGGCCHLRWKHLSASSKWGLYFKPSTPLTKSKALPLNSFDRHNGFWIDRLIVVIGRRRQPPSRQRCGQIDHRSGRSNCHYLLFLQFSNVARYPQRQNNHNNLSRPTLWLWLCTIAMISMVCGSHLDQVLLREWMPLPALFLDLDDDCASDEENRKKGFI